MACPEDIWRGVHASPTTRCAAWARNDVWGSGKNGLTLRESCSTLAFAQRHCAGTCCRQAPGSRAAFLDGPPCAHVPKFDPSAELRCPAASQQPPFRVLFFVVVGQRYSGLISNMCQQLLRLGYVDLYLVHHDNSGIVERTSDGRLSGGAYTFLPWYRRVRYARTATARRTKAQHVRHELILNTEMRKTVLREYSHVWVADENIAFPDSRQLNAFLRAVNASRAAIAQPSIRGSSHSAMAPSARCAVRHTDFVEVMFPIMRACVFEHVYTTLYVGQQSDWGLDKLWCRYFERFEPWRRGGACQLITAGRFVKLWDHARNTSSYDRDDADRDGLCFELHFERFSSRCVTRCCDPRNDPSCSQRPSFTEPDPWFNTCRTKGTRTDVSALLFGGRGAKATGAAALAPALGRGAGRGARRGLVRVRGEANAATGLRLGRLQRRVAAAGRPSGADTEAQ